MNCLLFSFWEAHFLEKFLLIFIAIGAVYIGEDQKPSSLLHQLGERTGHTHSAPDPGVWVSAGLPICPEFLCLCIFVWSPALSSGGLCSWEQTGSPVPVPGICLTGEEINVSETPVTSPGGTSCQSPGPEEMPGSHWIRLIRARPT